MKYFLGFLAVLAVVHCELKAGLRARMGLGGLEEVNKTIFFDLPKNVTEAVSFGWNKTARPDGPLSGLVMYCPENRTVCTLYDDTEYVAGVQVALEKSRVFNHTLNWTVQGFISWSTDDGKEYWTQHQYFVHEDYLAKCKEDRIASRNASQVLQLDSIWITGQDGEIVPISRSREDIEGSIFTTQACYPEMGQHFFYNVSSTTECDSRGLYPWFLLTGADSLIATGFLTLGTYPVQSSETDWLDGRSNATVFKTIIPDGPECFYERSVLTLHIYYVEEPWAITCPP